MEKIDNFSKMCANEIEKFSLHYITHHGHIANLRISISLVISTFKNSYLSYSLSDFSETFTNMFLLFFSILSSQINNNNMEEVDHKDKGVITALTR